MKPEMSKVNRVNGSMTHEGNGTSQGRNSYVSQVAADRHQTTAQKLHLKIGTWNVRTLYRAGLLENVVYEMNRAKLDILGLCQTRRTGNCRLELGYHTILLFTQVENKMQKEWCSSRPKKLENQS